MLSFLEKNRVVKKRHLMREAIKTDTIGLRVRLKGQLMRRPILTFLVTTAVFLGFDMIWLGGIAKAFYLRELGGLARLVNGQWDPIVWARGSPKLDRG